MHPIEGAIYFSALFGIPGMTYIVMAYAVMAYAVAAYAVMAYVVVAYVVMAHIVMALFGVFQLRGFSTQCRGGCSEPM